MDAQGHGQIVNVSSVGGFVVQPTAAVYAATKFAVRAISERSYGEHQSPLHLHLPGRLAMELANTISDDTARDAVNKYRAMAIKPDAIGRAILFALKQPNEVDVNEIVVRPQATRV